MVNTHKPLSGLNSIDGLLWDGWKWDFSPIVYAFPNTAADYPTASSGFETLNTMQRDAARIAFRDVANFTNISFFEGTAPGTINLAAATMVDTDNDNSGPGGADVPDNTIGTASGRSPSQAHVDAEIDGDIWFHPTNYDTPLVGSSAFASGIIHEIGHALGLKHPHQTEGAAPLLNANDGLAFTIMSYRDYPGDGIAGVGSEVIGSGNNSPQSYMMLDIAALQYLYGANFVSNGDTTYRFTRTIQAGLGTNFFVNGAEFEPSVDLASNVVFRTIWDPGGYDTYDFSDYITNLTVDLNPGQWTNLGTQLAALEDGQSPPGNIANALLFNGDQRSLIERAIGGSGNDTIIGNVIGNVLMGGAGDDVLFGLDGTDELLGGFGHDELHGGAGPDTVSYETEPFAGGRNGVTADLWLGKGFGGDGVSDLYYDIEHLEGSGGHDDLSGDEGNNILWGLHGVDTLQGREGSDSLKGGGGDDVLDGGIGADDLTGDEGSDTASYASATTAVVADLGAPGNNTGDAAGDHYFLIENVSGSNFGDTLRGDAAANTLSGGGGADTLDGRAEDDTLIGGLGDDTYYLSDVSAFFFNGHVFGEFYDEVQEAANAGNDTIVVGYVDGIFDHTAYTLGANIENGFVSGTAAFDIEGNNLDNFIWGNDARNALGGGGAGNDYLKGFGGDDLLAGGIGDDILQGGTGFIDTLDGGEGNDTATYLNAVSGVLADLGSSAFNGGEASGDHYTSVENLQGSFHVDELRGNEGANRLDGVDGGDVFFGRGGNDLLIGGLGNDTLNGGVGIDLADFAGARSAYALTNLGGGNVRVVGPDGVDSMTQVERLAFDDATLAFPLTNGNDFNADFFGDILWRNTNTGQTASWELNGAGGFAFDGYGAANLAWEQIAADDFNADGKGDILWRNTNTGQVGVWELDGASGFVFEGYGAAGLTWRSVGSGDFNGDGIADILFRNSSNGQVATWELNGAGGFTFDNYGAAGLAWKIVGIGDFNEDGKDDILWRNSSSGQVATWELNGAGGFAFDSYGSANLSRHIFGVGDFNADGKEDVLWRDNNGQVATWELNGNGGFAYDGYGGAGSQWAIMHATDTNSDGKDDVLWRNTATGQVAAWELNGSGGMSFQGYGAAGAAWQAFDGNFEFV